VQERADHFLEGIRQLGLVGNVDLVCRTDIAKRRMLCVALERGESVDVCACVCEKEILSVARYC